MNDLYRINLVHNRIMHESYYMYNKLLINCTSSEAYVHNMHTILYLNF